MALSGPYAFDAVNGAKLEEVHRTFTAFMMDSLGKNPRWSQSLGVFQPLPTRGSEAKAKMGSRAGGVHEWDGEREFADVQFDDHAILVKDWANALRLKMNDLDDDDMNLGLYRPLVADLIDDFDEHKHQLLIKLLAAGNGSTLGVCYDGQNFFSTSHPCQDLRMDGGQAGVTTWSNLETGALTHATLYTAINTMAKIRKPNGMIANVNPTHIIAPVALRATVDYILKSDVIVDATNGTKTNPLKGRLEPLFDPRLDAESTTAYYLWDSTQVLKPFFLADRAPVTSQVDITGEFNRQIKFGAWARYNMGYAFPQTLLKSTGA